MVLTFAIYILSKNERFIKTFFGDDTVDQKVWFLWLLITVGWVPPQRSGFIFFV